MEINKNINMLTIRLTRKGKKNQPFFRVVVIDKRRTASGGRAVEDLGYVDPLTKRKNLKKERILYWISKGAKPTPTIHNYLVAEKIVDAKKINVSKKSKAAPAAAGASLATEGAGKPEEAAPAAAAPAVVEKPAEVPNEEEKPEAPKEGPKSEEKPFEEKPAPAAAPESSGEAKEEPKA